jgi:hypothetical protein
MTAYPDRTGLEGWATIRGEPNSYGSPSDVVFAATIFACQLYWWGARTLVSDFLSEGFVHFLDSKQRGLCVESRLSKRSNHNGHNLATAFQLTVHIWLE